jgi:hypothetical protein
MSNVEGRYSVYFIRKTEQSETILRHSIFDILRFCGLLFNFLSFIRGVSPAAGRGIGQFDQEGKMPHTFRRILTAKCLAPEISGETSPERNSEPQNIESTQGGQVSNHC